MVFSLNPDRHKTVVIFDARVRCDDDCGESMDLDFWIGVLIATGVIPSSDFRLLTGVSSSN
jgi:hypothetical protein